MTSHSSHLEARPDGGFVVISRWCPIVAVLQWCDYGGLIVMEKEEEEGEK